MKKNNLLNYIVISLLLISCSNLTEKEKKAQDYIRKIAQNTNTKLKLPAKIDDFTFAEKVKFNAKTNTLIYSYIIDIKDYGSESDFLKKMKSIENQQISRAINNQGKDINYEVLGVTIKSIYKDPNNDFSYSFKIKPKDYLENELKKSEKEKTLKKEQLFSKETFEIKFNSGIDYHYGDVLNKKNNLWEFKSTFSSKTSTLNLKTNIGKIFDKTIEQTDVHLILILEYDLGVLKYKSKDYRSIFEKEKLKEFDVSSFFEKKIVNLDNLQRYLEYLEIIQSYKIYDKSKKKEIIKNKKEIEYITKKTFKYSKKDLIELEKTLVEFKDFFKNSNNYLYLKNIEKAQISINLLNKKNEFCFRIFNDFEQITNDKYSKKIPTIDTFKVKNAEVQIFLNASNTNGFSFNGKIKTINITDKWNNHFVK